MWWKRVATEPAAALLAGVDPGHGPGDMAGATLEAQSRQWYRDQYRRMVLICVGALAVTLLSLLLNLFQLLARPEPRYFAFTSNFQLREIPSLSEPVASDAAIMNWVAETVASTLTLDFKSWKDRLIRLQDNYDPAALKQIVDALTASTGFVTLIEKERLVSSAVVQSPPLLKASGRLDGAAAWRIEFPVDVAFESSKGVVNTQKLLATATVTRVDPLRVERGMVIRQLVLGPR